MLTAPVAQANLQPMAATPLTTETNIKTALDVNKETAMPIGQLAGQLLLPQGSILATESVVLNIDRYTVQGSAPYQSQSSLRLTTQVNQVSPNTTLQLEALQDDIWVYVQYFTDVDGDGIYEWVVNQRGLPLWDLLSQNNELETNGDIDQVTAMKQGEARTISAMDLYTAGLNSLLARGQGGALALDGLDVAHLDRTIFCVSLSPQPYHTMGEEPELPPEVEDDSQDDGEPSPDTDNSSQEESSPEEEDALEEGIAPEEESSDLSPEPKAGEISTPDLVTYYLQIDPLGWNEPWVTGAATFSDLHPDDWYYKGVDYTVKNRFFLGVNETSFGPNNTLTRGMAIQMLYAYDGKPTVVKSTFGDVPSTAWYYAASCWAVDQNIAKVEGGNNLRPEAPITRQELIGLLYNFAMREGASLRATVDISNYLDYDQVSEAYIAPMTWAVEHGLIVGDPQGNMNPNGTATRSQTAQILTNWMHYVILPAQGM